MSQGVFITVFNRCFWRVAILLLPLSCAYEPTLDLERIYEMTEQHAGQAPVILIHGALGGRLEDKQGKEIWPGSLKKIAFSQYLELALPFDKTDLMPTDSDTHVAGIAETAAGRDFYGKIIKTLENIGGYSRGQLGQPGARDVRRYYVFSYDWRQDNVVSAKKLHNFIETVRQDYKDPSLKVDIIAHSMGGLITRYYARYGNVDVLNSNELLPNNIGEQRIRRVVMLGTPSLGSVGALRTLIRGYKVGLGVIPPEVVATFPSTYQVLPHALTQWFVTIDGQPLKRDQFDAQGFWKRFQFSVYSESLKGRMIKRFDSEKNALLYLDRLQRFFERQIERARRFSWALSVPTPSSTLQYIVFGGDCLATPARVVVEEIEKKSYLRLWPKEIINPKDGVDYQRLMFEPGDGTVTKASLLARTERNVAVARHKYSNFSLDYPVFLCESHERLTGNIDFQNNLLHALLSADR